MKFRLALLGLWLLHAAGPARGAIELPMPSFGSARTETAFRPPEADDYGMLELDGGDRLKVRLERLDPLTNTLTVRHPFFRNAAGIEAAALASFTAAASRPNDAPLPGWMVEFRDGDRIRGDELAVDGERVRFKTLYGSAMNVPRSAVRALTSSHTAALYEGPSVGESWMLDGQTLRLNQPELALPKERTAALSLSSLPRKLRLDFEVSSSEPLRLFRVIFRADTAPTPNAPPGQGHQLTLSATEGTQLHRFHSSKQLKALDTAAFSLGDVAKQIPRGVSFSLFSDPGQRKVHLFADGRRVAVLRDPEATGSSGRFIAFWSDQPATIRHIRVLPWEDLPPEATSETPADPHREGWLFKTGGGGAGAVLEIRSGQATLRSRDGDTTVPLTQIETIRLEGKGLPPTPEPVVEVALLDGSFLRLRIEKIEEGVLHGVSRGAGNIRMPVRAVAQMRWRRATEDSSSAPDLARNDAGTDRGKRHTPAGRTPMAEEWGSLTLATGEQLKLGITGFDPEAGVLTGRHPRFRDPLQIEEAALLHFTAGGERAEDTLLPGWTVEFWDDDRIRCDAPALDGERLRFRTLYGTEMSVPRSTVRSLVASSSALIYEGPEVGDAWYINGQRTTLGAPPLQLQANQPVALLLPVLPRKARLDFRISTHFYAQQFNVSFFADRPHGAKPGPTREYQLSLRHQNTELIRRRNGASKTIASFNFNMVSLYQQLQGGVEFTIICDLDQREIALFAQGRRVGLLRDPEGFDAPGQVIGFQSSVPTVISKVRVSAWGGGIPDHAVKANVGVGTDGWRLKTGVQVTGTLLEIRGDRATLRSARLGDLTVSLGQIETLSFQGGPRPPIPAPCVETLLSDGSFLRLRIERIEDGVLYGTNQNMERFQAPVRALARLKWRRETSEDGGGAPSGPEREKSPPATDGPRRNAPDSDRVNAKREGFSND